MLKFFFNDEQIVKYLRQKGYIVEKKELRVKSIENARKSRQQEIERKVKQAIEKLKQEEKEITASAVAKKAGVNWRTAKKYL